MNGGSVRTAITGSVQVTEALGQAESFLEFQNNLSRVAPVDRPVLILGERGTGKELAATRLHFLSKRWKGPLVALNCAALNPELIESELFGFEKGAFTGAERQRKGRFEAADEGTLFLDEIGLIPLEAQAKILRVVEYGTFERVGSSTSIEVDVRIVAATNADLPALVAEGRFRQDLLDRLAFEVLVLPPLRQRREDIMLLANHFAGRMAIEIGKDPTIQFSAEAIALLEGHSWPGNIRELKNLIERSVYRSDTDQIDAIVFNPFKWDLINGMPKDKEPAAQKEKDSAAKKLLDLQFEEAVEALKIRLIVNALKASRYNQKAAATMLGLTYDQFRGVYRKYKDRLAAQ
ncbi:MAG: phage shock protein operon transcriptional activator [Desulfobacteraceae bacterium]|jgi:psp operon transcriptional activator